MLNYYKRSIKAFKNYIKENPYCIKEDWDKYAQDNCLFSAQTLMFHLNIKNFEELKSKNNKNWFRIRNSIFSP